MIRQSLFLSFFLIINTCASLIFAQQKNDHYYDVSFLKNYSQVRAVLKAEGFKEIYFKTPDNLRIHGFFLSRPAATCNVIVCAGWLPGRKEEMSTFFATLPPYCNILLFDARGHGKSEGPLFSQLWKYGVNEYKDIIGAIQYVHFCNTLPTFLCGICSGAFNATHAVLNLENQGLLSKYNIKGVIFDSGWASVIKTSRTVAIGGSDKRMSLLFRSLLGYNLSTIRSSLPYKLLFSVVEHSINVAHLCLFAFFMKRYEKRTNLLYKIKNTQVPFFFIHSYNDLYADINDVQQLAALIHHKECWWIENGSYHAYHHLKKKELYQEKIAAFIEKILVA